MPSSCLASSCSRCPCLLLSSLLQVSNLFADLENDDSACKLDIMLVYEVYTEAQAMMLYPINVLRNLARVQARTHLLALVDVDMLMGSRFYRDLRNDLAFSQRLVEAARARTAFVLPAFETYGSVYEAAAIADLLASRDKLFLMDGIKKGIIGPFDHKRFPQVRLNTNQRAEMRCPAQRQLVCLLPNARNHTQLYTIL